MQNIEEKSSNNVDYRFKILYALGIIFIVMGHCNGGGVSLFYEIFPYYSFHLALFVFVSGYFYNSKYEDNIAKFGVNKVKKLIIPLYMWNLFYAFVLFIIKKFGFFEWINIDLKSLFLTPVMHGHQFALNLGGWFVIPLFMVHIINILIRKICCLLGLKINEFIYFGIYLLFGFLGVLLAAKGYNKEWFLVLDRVLYFMPFYSLGILYKKYEKYDKINNSLYFGAILIIALFYIYKNGGMPTFTPSWCNFGTSNILKPFVVGVLAIAFWLRISKILTPSIGKSKTVNIIADHTYTIMINHLACFMVVKTVYALLHKYLHCCGNFNVIEYKTNVFYCYVPHNLNQFLIIYVIAGIGFSILLEYFIAEIWRRLKALYCGCVRRCRHGALWCARGISKQPRNFNL